MSACPQQLLKKDGVFYAPLCMMNNAIEITSDDDSKKRKHMVDKLSPKKQAKKESKELEETEETYAVFTKPLESEKRNRSAYAFYFQDQRSKVKEALQAANDGQTPSTTEVTAKVAENWQVLKANAENSNAAAIEKLTGYAKMAADDKTRYTKSKQPLEEPSEQPEKKVKKDKTPTVSPEGWKPGDKGKAPEWYRKGIKTGDWQPGNKGATPLWFQAGMRGMSIDDLKTAKKAAKED